MCSPARFEALLCLLVVSFHLLATDLEAAAVVSLAVHVVQALAAYERGVEGLANREAHRVFVWRALLRRVESRTQYLARTTGGIGRHEYASHMQGPGEGRRRARRASIFSVTLQRASWVLLVHSLSARWANGSGDGGGGRLGGRKGGCGLGDGGGGGGVDDTVQNWQLSWQLAMIDGVLHLVILSMSVLNSRWHFSASLSTHAGRDGNGGDGSEPGGGGGEGDGSSGGLGEGDGSGDDTVQCPQLSRQATMKGSVWHLLILS